MQRQGRTEVKEHEHLAQRAKSEDALAVKQEEKKGSVLPWKPCKRAPRRGGHSSLHNT